MAIYPTLSRRRENDKVRKIVKFARVVCDRLTDFELIQDLLLMRPTEHIVRGFIFERSSAKDHFYLLRLISPLFSPVTPNLSLNYSDRISLDGRTVAHLHVQGEKCGELEKILQVLDFKQVPVLRSVTGPEGFIRYCSELTISRVNMKLELAIAHCLVEDTSAGKALMTEVFSETRGEEHPFFVEVREQTQRVFDALEAGHHEFHSLIREFENQNVRRHFPGLTQESCWA
jgi:hypothetical protein